MPISLSAALLAASSVAFQAASETEDSYARYVQTAPEFQAVRQDRELLSGCWDRWIYMLWRYRWTIGTGEAGGRFCRDYGIRGGFLDHGEGPLDWLEQWGPRFDNDHAAGKGDLYAHHPIDRARLQALQCDPRAIRDSRWTSSCARAPKTSSTSEPASAWATPPGSA